VLAECLEGMECASRKFGMCLQKVLNVKKECVECTGKSSGSCEMYQLKL
jgi:hypothetical protein